MRPCLTCGRVAAWPTRLRSWTALDRAGYRLTEPRRALAALIADQDGHFTAAELVVAARARRLGIGRATVFRTLEILAEVGAVERLDLPIRRARLRRLRAGASPPRRLLALRPGDRDRRFGPPGDRRARSRARPATGSTTTASSCSVSVRRAWPSDRARPALSA